jgi:hypothetical protein
LGVEAVGNISQTPTSTISAGGETTLASTTGDVTLDGTDNDFGIINVSGKDVSLADKNGITLGEVATTGTLGVEAVGNISQTPTSTISAGGETTLASTTGDVTLDGAFINSTSKLKLGDVKLEFELQGSGATKDNITSSDISNFITKDVQNVEKDIKVINENLNNLNSKELVNNDSNNSNFIGVILDNFSENLMKSISFVSIPSQKGDIEKVTLSELIAIYDQSNPENKEQNSEIKIPIFENSLVGILNGGVSLPEGVEQEFYLVRQDINIDSKNKKNNGVN